MGLIRGIKVSVAVAIVLAVTAAQARGAPTLPEGFVDERVVDKSEAPVSQPTALAFLPNDNMLVARKSGQLEVFTPDGEHVVTALDFSQRMCKEGERGLVGVAVDPAFASNRFVYLYGTFSRLEGLDCQPESLVLPVNRIVRVKLGDDFKMVEQRVLIDGMVNAGTVHTGGDLFFGKDGFLYATTGDGGCHYSTPCSGGTGANTAAREPNTLLGKLIRINRSGGVPPDNPFRINTARCDTGPATPGQTCAEMYALGLRNPFRFAFDPNAAGTRFFVNDVGAGRWEEVNLGTPGADYGWNVREGHCRRGSYTDCHPFPSPTPLGMTDPIWDYRHDSGCSSIVGGAFVPGGLWGEDYRGSYLYVDFVCAKLFRLDEELPGSFRANEVGELHPTPVHLRFGPTEVGGQALYYTRFAGEIRRIRLGEGATPPPENGTDPPGNAPVPEITAPAADFLFKMGDTITLRGKATDAEDGTLDGDDLTWEVERVHDNVRLQNDTHSHPLLEPTPGSEVTITAPPPEDLFSADENNFLRVKLTATDSDGLSTTIVREIRPKVVHIVIGSNPPGVDMTGNGEDFRTPIKLGSWPGYRIRLVAPSMITNDGLRFFCRWNDGVRANERTITTPDGTPDGNTDLLLWATYKTIC